MTRNSSAVAKFLFIGMIVSLTLHAQSPDLPKYEVGAGYSLLHTNFDGFDLTRSGITARFVYSPYKHLAVEGELNAFPQDLGVNSKGMTEGLFGAKSGWRSQKLGIFGKIRPGFVHFSEQREPFPCIAVFPPPLACTLGRRTEFAMDAGAVLEFYTHSSITVRLDTGDTMIRFRGPLYRPLIGTSDGFWSHNFQFGSSVVFRF
jgi:hypothetical protein